MEPTGPNAEQIKYWNEQAGPKWVAAEDELDRMIGVFGDVARLALAPRPGEHVLDVGCGTGATTLDLARRVGPSGRVTAIDISRPMLARARERAKAAGLDHATFTEADAQTHDFRPASVDAVHSRFGVMFFVDPTAAFRNLRRSLRPGGRASFVCWQPMPENPWMLVPLMAVAQHVALPPPPAPDAPGPFAFGDRERVQRILRDAGFAEVAIEPLAVSVTLAAGGGLDRAVDFVLRLGPTSALLRDAGPGVQEKAVGAIREALTPYVTPAGVVMPSAAWVVSAR